MLEESTKNQDAGLRGQSRGREAGDFRWLFETYHEAVSHFFANRGFTEEECRDLTQETFLAVFTSSDRFRGDSAVGTWLFSIATNIWRNTVRSRSRAKRKARELSFEELGEQQLAASAVNSDDPSGPAEPLQRALTEERVRLVREALEELPESMRFCTLLRLDQGLKYREIAVAMQMSIEHVKSQLFQARAKLKHRLAKDFEDVGW